MRAGVAMVVAACALAAGLPGGCAGRGMFGVEEAGPFAFAASSIRIYPLTQVERGADGGVRIVLHLELKDRWGDSAKGLGVLRVMLFKPVSGVMPGIEEQTQAWEVDLRGVEENQMRFDPATRTYRVVLRDVAPWVGEGGATVRLRATFETIGPDGRDVVLRDEYVMDR